MAMLLERVRDDSEVFAEEPIKDVVLTVPPFWAQDERQALLDSVLSGAIRPLKGTYTLWLFDSGGRIHSRQATPEEAYFSAAELSRLVEALGDDWGLLFVALSYRWIVC